MTQKRTLLLGLVLACVLSGCIHPRKVDVQQGNLITMDMMDQLKPGMTTTEVAHVMGSPVLMNTFSRDRVDYVYTNKIGRGEMTQKTLTLHFKDGKLTNFDADFRPSDANPPEKETS